MNRFLDYKHIETQVFRKFFSPQVSITLTPHTAELFSHVFPSRAWEQELKWEQEQERKWEQKRYWNATL